MLLLSSCPVLQLPPPWDTGLSALPLLPGVIKSFGHVFLFWQHLPFVVLCTSRLRPELVAGSAAARGLIPCPGIRAWIFHQQHCPADNPSG